MSDYRVYFQHPSLSVSHVDISAASYRAAEASVASAYGLATHIKAVPLNNIFPELG